MKVLFDTNIVLDVLLDRVPFSTPASVLFTKVDKGELIGVLCATTLTTVHYLHSKTAKKKTVTENIRLLLELFEVAPVDQRVLARALDSKIPDFEDAVLEEAGKQSSAGILVTRDRKGFKNSSLTVYEPDPFLKVLKTLP